ncbi:MAG: hypothetical protein SFU98_11425 [Leptospiraceae bacterium]|nr:hypothetical protein [Leptospiraceae bacterium]
MFQSIPSQKLKQLAFYSGITLILFSLLFVFILPFKPAISNHSGFSSTILSFELAKNPIEIMNILGKPGDAQLPHRVESFSRAVGLDYFYIFVYSLFFLFSFEIFIQNLRSTNLLRVSFFLLLISLISADILENLYQAELLDSSLGFISQELLSIMFLLGITKWVLFTLVIGFLGFVIFFSNSTPMKYFGLFLVIPTFLLCLLYTNLWILELNLGVSTVGILFLTIHFWKTGFGSLRSKQVPVFIKSSF